MSGTVRSCFGGFRSRVRCRLVAELEAGSFENHRVWLKLPESQRLRGPNLSRRLERPLDEASFLILLWQPPIPYFPPSRPLPEEEMKGPPVLVVGETQLPWIDEWLLCRASPLLHRPAPPPCSTAPLHPALLCLLLLAIGSRFGFCSLTFI